MQFIYRHTLLSIFLCIFALGLTSYAEAQKSPRPHTKTVRTVVTVTPATAAKYAPLPPEQVRRQEAFLKAWGTISNRYFDRTFNGLDWDKVRQDFMPRVNAAKSDAEVHRLIEEMIGKLDKSHFGLIPPEYFASLKAVQQKVKEGEKQVQPGGDQPDGTDGAKNVSAADEDVNARYGIGIELRSIDNKFVITSVEEKSGATIAGLRPGFVLDKINGVAMSDLTARLMAAYPNVRHLQRYLPLQIVALFLNGERDTSVFLTCLDESDQVKEYKVPRLTLGGQYMTIGQRFPTLYLQFHTASLSDDVGYVKFNVFGVPLIGKFCDALTEFSKKKAIIVDLRGNIGGLLGSLIGLSGMLNDGPVTIGTSLYRDHNEIITADPKAKNFKGKLVFLVDGETMSAGELFTAGLQENGRILVVGERTAGEALPAGTVELATGAVLMYPVANFRTSQGKYVEGHGVQPDFVVALDRKSLLKGEDPQLNKALDLINNGTEFPKVVNGDPTGPKIILGDEDTPPPPPKKAPPVVGGGSGLAAARPPAQKPKDARALKVLTDFAAAIGGADGVRKIASYEVNGNARIGEAGADVWTQYHAYRELPDKYSIIMSSPSMGEIREIHNGKNSFVQADYGAENELHGYDTAKTHLFAPLTNLTDPALFNSLEYLGEFAGDGQKLKLIQGTIGPGMIVALAFDSTTNLLVRCSFPGFSYTLGDYRKVDTLTLPFAIKLEHMMDIKLDSIKLNGKIDPANFQKKEKCFDKPL
jgi:carboxyl-terminal processing protease